MKNKRFWFIFDTETDLQKVFCPYDFYVWNLNVYSCIEKLQENFLTYWFNILNWWKIIKNETLKDIFYYDPNVERIQSNYFYSFKNLIIRDLKINWNVFIEIIKTAWWQVKGFYVLPPETMEIKIDTYWRVLRYVQNIQNEDIVFNKEDIYHYKDKSDPERPNYWFSWLKTLCYELYAEKEANEMMHSFYKNRCIPSVAFLLEDWINWQRVWDRIKEEFSWTTKQFKTAILSWVKEIKNLNVNHKDIWYLEQKSFYKKNICQLFWVPPILIWVTEWLNYSNGTTQYDIFYNNTIAPNNKVWEIIFQDLINISYKSNHTVEAINNYSNIEKDKSEYIKNLNWILTTNEQRQELWREPIEEEWYDEALTSKNNISVSDVLLEDKDEIHEEEKKQTPEKKKQNIT